MSQQAAKRRRKQAAKCYRHIAPLRRPHYPRPDAGTSAERLRRRIQREREMTARGGGKKK